ncbi:Rad1-domain-containing protein [Amylocystis lapponica]|nr:Rad1-domain-containing protein [Amylocystis lapponica]
MSITSSEQQSPSRNRLYHHRRESRTLLATAFIVSDIFDEFTYNPDADDSASQPSASQDPPAPSHTALEIPLNTSSSVSMSLAQPTHPHPPPVPIQARPPLERDHNGRIEHYFGSEKGTGMRLSYAGAGNPLVLLISDESDGPTATCEITTFDPEPHLDLPFEADDAILRIILKSTWLRDALSELDPSCEKLTIIGNPPPPAGKAARAPVPRLRLHAAGTFGSTEMDYPSDKEVLESCDCEESVSFSYRFGHISRALRALQSSTKTSLRINTEGLLSLQLIMPAPRPGGGTAQSFIEFRCLPLEEGS